MDISWTRTSLGDICMFRAGTAFPKRFQGEMHGEIPFIKVSDLKHRANSLYIRHSANWVDMVTVEHLKASLLYPGTIVFAKIGEGLKAERFRLIARPTCIDNNLMGAIPQGVDAHFLYYLMVHTGVAHLVEGSALPYLRQSDLERIPVCVPSNDEQQRIAGVLGALDDKIESNLRVRNLCRDLGGNLVADTVRSAPSTQLEHYAASISRGVTPQYYKDEDASPVLVLNQKCIRDGWVTPELARLMIPRSREKSQAIARLDDLLVNSTGQGTLGRVARWDSDDPIYVDSHVTVVKADPRRIYPVLMPYLVFPLQDEIEHMATGSTGQTELSPSRLAQLNVPLLSLEEQRPLSARLVALEAQAHYCQVQSLKLTELRDALLPELMSGRMRVDEAGCLVSEALDEEVRSV